MGVIRNFDEEIVEIYADLALRLTTAAYQFQKIRTTFVELSQSLLYAQLFDELELVGRFRDISSLDIESRSDSFSQIVELCLNFDLLK